MKWVEEINGTKRDLLKYLEEMIGKLGEDALAVDSQKVNIPGENELKCKVKYSEDEDSIKLAIKISYDKEVAPEEEEM